jgi:D-alanyl-D-alanine carboxypeptidase
MSNAKLRNFAIAAALCSAALLFAACGQTDDAASSESAEPSGIQSPATAGDPEPDTPPGEDAVQTDDGSQPNPGNSSAGDGASSAGDGQNGSAGDPGSESEAGGTEQEPAAETSGKAGLIPALEDTITVSQGIAYVTNASAIEVIVNKQRNLPADYEPDDLVVPDIPFSFSGDDPKKQMRKEAAEAIEQLFAAAKEDGIELAGVSGYRSYARQKAIFEANVQKKGEQEANRVSAYPGQSEHQTGLTMDVSSKSVNYALEEEFGESKEGKWLAEHAHEYGFIIRYPKDKEDVTGYVYEPWHIRYVGKELAAAVYESGLTLEEFAEQNSVPVSAEK